MKRFVVFCGVGIVAALFSACATQSPTQVLDPPGFWRGLFDGFTILFSLIASIFTDHRIYAYPNAGGWYDFGYFLGVTAVLGGGATAEASREDTKRHELNAGEPGPKARGDKDDVSGQPGPH